MVKCSKDELEMASVYRGHGRMFEAMSLHHKPSLLSTRQPENMQCAQITQCVLTIRIGDSTIGESSVRCSSDRYAGRV